MTSTSELRVTDSFAAAAPPMVKGEPRVLEGRGAEAEVRGVDASRRRRPSVPP